MVPKSSERFVTYVRNVTGTPTGGGYIACFQCGPLTGCLRRSDGSRLSLPSRTGKTCLNCRNIPAPHPPWGVDVSGFLAFHHCIMCFALCSPIMDFAALRQ